MEIFKRWFGANVGIDLGTANTLIYVGDYGIALREPSVIAVDNNTNSTLAVGESAWDMLGRTPSTIRALRPLRHGVVAELRDASAMLREFMKNIQNSHSSMRNPQFAIAVPAGITGVERIAIRQLAEDAHAGHLYMPCEPLCAAIGANLPLDQATGSMIVDIGGGTTEVAVLSFGDVVANESIRIAGDEMDEAIIAYLKVVRSFEVGTNSAEQLKINLGSAWQTEVDDSMEVCGRNLKTGFPGTINVVRSEIRSAIATPVSCIVQAIKDALSHTPPELASDIADHGLFLVGGGALLQGLDDLIEHETELPVMTVADPISCVAEGTGKLLANRAYTRLLDKCKCA